MKSAEYFDTHRVEILALYNANGTSQTIIKALSMPFCRGLLDRWLCENVPREERLKHRHRIMSANAKLHNNNNNAKTFYTVVKYPKDGPGCKPKLCGNCKAWTPDKGARGQGPRLGQCGKHNIRVDRCDVCTEGVIVPKGYRLCPQCGVMVELNEPCICTDKVPFLDDCDYKDCETQIDPVTGERFYSWERGARA